MQGEEGLPRDELLNLVQQLSAELCKKKKADQARLRMKQMRRRQRSTEDFDPTKRAKTEPAAVKRELEPESAPTAAAPCQAFDSPADTSPAWTPLNAAEPVAPPTPVKTKVLTAFWNYADTAAVLRDAGRVFKSTDLHQEDAKLGDDSGVVAAFDVDGRSVHCKVQGIWWQCVRFGADLPKPTSGGMYRKLRAVKKGKKDSAPAGAGRRRRLTEAGRLGAGRLRPAPTGSGRVRPGPAGAGRGRPRPGPAKAG